MKYFGFSTFVLICGLALAYWRGESEHSGTGFAFLFSALVICALEVSVSFDNAVVNATKLKKMSHEWRRRFLTWGIAIAVFGMRFIFPIAIVSIFSQIGMGEVLKLALHNPDEYAKHLHEANVGISSFGGTFLMMLFFEFFLDKNKNLHWIKHLEIPMKKAGDVKFFAVAATFSCLVFLQIFLPAEKMLVSVVSGVAGILTHSAIHGASAFLERKAEMKSAFALKHAGLVAFIYLELIDASFSLDGVLGAFALTKDVVVIAIGLGVGAFFVRSLTIVLVEKNTLDKLVYLAHGAYWAIGALAVIMFGSTIKEVPELITGAIGMCLIISSLISSILERKKKA